MPSPAKPSKRSFMPADTIASNVLSASNPLLTPAEAAQLLGLSTSWLANARAGQTGYDGPPYVKLPGGRTAPIRYYLRDLQQWLAQCEYQINTFGAKPPEPVMQRSYADFQQHATPQDKWLMAIDPASLTCVDVFESLNQLERKPQRLVWLTKKEITKARFFSTSLTAAELRLIREHRKAATK